MNEQVETILASINSDMFETVARGALDDPKATLVGAPKWHPVGGVHNDWQTIAVLRCTGNANSDGVEKDWSAVLKIVSLSAPVNPTASYLNPRNEEMLYEDGMLSNSSTPFRAVRCYLVAHYEPDGIFLWLEDLSVGSKPPWNRQQYVKASHNLGRFHGRNFTEHTRLPYVGFNNNFAGKWKTWGFDRAAKTMREQRNDAEFRQAFSGNRLELVLELIETMPALLERVGGVERVLSHGDCHSRNLFFDDEVTVAIDWAGVSYEPIGCDFGQLAGNGLSWSHNERILVAETVPELFDSYVEGLSEEGWHGDLTQLRLGMFGQFAGYLGICCTLPALVINDGDGGMTERIEQRMGVSKEEIPLATNRFLDITEPYIHEAIVLSGGK